jgi:CheY-like chemotaxis protein
MPRPTHILVVEDEALMNDFLASYLGAQGYEVTMAYDGAEALEKMRRRPPELALIDLLMPGMGGWELVRQMRADRVLRRVPILICTAHKEARLPARLVQGIVHKPFQLEEIGQQVKSCLAQPV